MNVIICKNYHEISKKASEIVIDQIKRKPTSVLGLATGSTPLGLYEYLSKAYQEGKVSFKDVSTFNLDEYIGISHDHPQSYHYYMDQHFFSEIDIKDENTHLPENDEDCLEENIEQYNDMLKENPIDLQILGIGSNGHIGFNEPGTPFSNETFIAYLDEQTRKDNARFFDSFDEVPKEAITMGIKNIMKSKKILLLASGEEKADAIQDMIHGEVTEDLPASILQLHPDVTIIIDKQAAKKLSS